MYKLNLLEASLKKNKIYKIRNYSVCAKDGFLLIRCKIAFEFE